MDRDGLGDHAQVIAAGLRSAGLAVTYDDAGAIGRRYRRQDEVGTPYCVTVDYETIGEQDPDSDPYESFEPGTVTVRERDTTAQRRIPESELAETLTALRDGEITFAEI
jgi:glycyl-tRNA synthetase